LGQGHVRGWLLLGHGLPPGDADMLPAIVATRGAGAAPNGAAGTIVVTGWPHNRCPRKIPPALLDRPPRLRDHQTRLDSHPPVARLHHDRKPPEPRNPP